MNLQDKTVLLTGGSLGIGKATAQKLIERGAKVAITGRNMERLQAAASEIGAFAIQADVSKPEDIDRTYQEFLAEFGHLDVLVNNAGLAKGGGSMTESKLEDFQYVYGINVFGAAMMGQQAARLFQEQNYGHIINIASTAALKGYANGSIYASSKFALRGLTQCWQAELRKHNVRVIQINPTYVATAFGKTDGVERAEESNKLRSEEVAHTIVAALEMDDRAFIPEVTLWATNPW